MPLAKLNGVQFYYEVEGRGDPVLFIMGTGLPHTLWAKQVEALKDHYTCISFDNRGTGQTDVTAEGHTVRNYAKDAAALLRHLDVGPAHVVGWSLGSCIAQELALNDPELVSSMVLIATWCKPYPFLRRRFEVQIQIAETGNQRLLGEYSVLHLFRADYLDDHDQEVLDFQRRSMEGKGRAPMHILIAHYRMDIAHDTADRLHRINVPALVLGGRQDPLVRAPYQEEVARRIPNAQLNLIENADHMALAVIPDEINRVMLNFLRQQRGTQRGAQALAS